MKDMTLPTLPKDMQRLIFSYVYSSPRQNKDFRLREVCKQAKAAYDLKKVDDTRLVEQDNEISYLTQALTQKFILGVLEEKKSMFSYIGSIFSSKNESKDTPHAKAMASLKILTEIQEKRKNSTNTKNYHYFKSVEVHLDRINELLIRQVLKVTNLNDNHFDISKNGVLYFETGYEKAQDVEIPVTRIPGQIFSDPTFKNFWENVTRFSLRSCRSLFRLPSEISQLKNLITLEVTNGRVSSLPSTVGELKNLKRLYLHNNELVFIPKEIGGSVNLEVLNLEYNNLISIPAEIGNLNALRDLRLRQNYLESIPDEINENVLYDLQPVTKEETLQSQKVSKNRINI